MTTQDPHPIWQAMLSPHRSVEVRAWLRQPDNAKAALAWRGPRGESMLHWAVMADMGLMLDLMSLGLRANDQDARGHTPADWLVERLWMTHREGLGQLTVLNLRKLRIQTDDLLSALWRAGGRPGATGRDPRILAMETGLWQVMATWQDVEGDWARTDWPCGTTLHAWPLAPLEQGRSDYLASWIADRSVDVEDAAGRTPLFLAVASRLACPDARKAVDLDAAIDALLAAGANPEHLAHDGQTPLSLTLSTAAADKHVAELLATRMDAACVETKGLEF